eukprot:CAMPEP_0201481250 /NCGR_PEP_ID=MMETSP0151_2-20130828/5537_1 /ASSEMBLY_ACC=CAM_ASM_000257 /TAXON_ID=200890 /ORGANISM="Paramoeba atlantica, Strain 621/1 / CCAP 1560/9" /LENGTH=302 /DNA_ID=CAMNT_0047863349 /DNA_START=62 /DNA_END=970 /DNA_ORIENTATION=-
MADADVVKVIDEMEVTYDDEVHPLDWDPDQAFNAIKKDFKIEKLDLSQPIEHKSKRVILQPDGNQPKREGAIRVVVLSDTHTFENYLPKLEADVLIHGGDFSSTGKPEEVKHFAEWLGSLDHIPHKVVIAGNHELTFDSELYPKELYKRYHKQPFDCKQVRGYLDGKCIYLENSAVSVHGIRIYGTPVTPWFHDWGFNEDRGEPIMKYWRRIPNDLDILLTHGPPLGHGDFCTSGNYSGCAGLLRVIQQRVKPLLHIFGHVHEGYGVTTDGETFFVNGSNCNVRYNRHQLNPPIYFDIFPPK